MLYRLVGILSVKYLREFMDNYRKLRNINIGAWLFLTALCVVLVFTSAFNLAMFRYFLVASLLAFFVIQFKVSFSKYSSCGNYIINPARFWFGTAIFTNAKVCKQCG
jgi:hypothetical protein